MSSKREEIVWGEPPPKRFVERGRCWLETLAPFVQRPGEWGRIPGHFVQSYAGQLRMNGQVGKPAGRWEFVSRSLPTLPKRRVAIWARYLGPEIPAPVEQPQEPAA